jgi:hypothetical protein
VVEIAKFDMQKLQNPDIEGIQYQNGVSAGYDNVRAYVFERDDYTCQICKKKEGILQTHHIKQKKDGGSDKPDNMVAVHKGCHEDFHKGLIQHKFMKPKEYKIEAHITILKDFVVDGLRKDFDVDVTFGHITKRNRMRLNLLRVIVLMLLRFVILIGVGGLIRFSRECVLQGADTSRLKGQGAR